jgi:hypothetical protein
MRINLVAPFAEKDAVKALGARWDVAKKCWYIVDVADLSPFSRWIPNMEAAKEGKGADGAAQVTKPRISPPALVNGPARPVNAPAKPANDVADCGCDVLPWDDCVHTAIS